MVPGSGATPASYWKDGEQRRIGAEADIAWIKESTRSNPRSVETASAVRFGSDKLIALQYLGIRHALAGRADPADRP